MAVPSTSLLDPYKAWLNVSVDVRPLNPYQLLGLKTFEASRLRIDAAVSRQLAKLDVKRAEADPKIWDQVRKEVEKAGVLLIDPQQKVVLDAQLKRQMATGGYVVPEGTSLDDTQKADADGASAREGGVKCHHCDKMNLPDRKFCAGCGQPMWEPCPNCKVKGPGGEKFCGACGTDIPQFLEERSKEWLKKLETAKKLHADNQFELSLHTLREVAKLDDPRYDKFARKATKYLEEFVVDRRQREGAVLVAYEKAQRYMEANDFENAVRKLDKIPARLQTKDVVALLEQAKAKVNDVTTLTREIQTGLDAGRTIEVLPKIERLLAIKPDSENVRKLGLQIGQKICRGAQKLVAEQRHEETLKLLRQIPTFAAPPEAEVMIDNASEMAWLWNEVRKAPFASPCLLEIAERLQKDAPNNDELTNLIEALRKRLKAKSSQPWMASIPRSTLPKTSQIGIPASSLGGLRTIAFAAGLDSKLYDAHPGRFLVACGLALQGLGKAAFPINMVPEEKKTGLAGLTSLAANFQKKKAETVAWGIDLSSTSIKLVKMSREGKDDVVRIDDYDIVELPFSTTDSPDADLESTVVAEDAFRALVEKHKITKADCVCVNMPGMRVLGRFFLTPPVEPKRLDSLIHYEVGQQIPYAVDDLAWDYACTDKGNEKSKEPQSRRVMIVASKLKNARARVAWFERAGLKVAVLQSECVALHNIVHYDQHRPNSATAGSDQEIANSAIVLLDVGGDISNVVISGPEVLWFRTIGVGGQDFSQPLLRAFNLTHEQVEELKRHPAKAKGLHKTFALLDAPFSQLMLDVQRSLATFKIAFPEVIVDELWGLGGGFQMHGLLGHFWGTTSEILRGE